MKRLCWLAWLVAWVAVPAVEAQVQVELRLANETVLLYESIPVEIRLRNVSGRTLTLGENPDAKAGWLSFFITDENGRVVDSVATLPAGDPVVLHPGESARRELDLLHLYELRSVGTYRIRATVTVAGTRSQSSSTRLIILAGNEVARQTVGVKGAAGAMEERTYTLVVYRGPAGYRIFVRVADEQAGMVYAMLPLGDYVPLGEPMLATDALGRLHVLIRGGSRGFQYRAIDPAGKIVDQAIYSDLQSSPRLVEDPAGMVRVRGGEKIFPRPPEAPAAPAPPPPPPKKKSWWQFWKK